MPTGTFFRLPEGKRERLIEAAWDEFTRVPFAESSINRIIQSAHIPRGSFYQYFADKEDLFFYIQSDVRNFFLGILSDTLTNSNGDLFVTTLQAYDTLASQNEEADFRLRRCGQLLQLNPELGLRNIISCRPDCLPQRILQMIDTSCFRQSDPEFVRNVCSLLFFSLGSSLIEVLFNPEQRQDSRKTLEERIHIIQCGTRCDFAPAALSQ